MSARKYLIGLIGAALLIWGPRDPGWLRMGSLIAIPVASWFFLGWIWSKWQPDAATEDRSVRALAGATGGLFAVWAILSALADTHVGNTMWVRTRDGMEAVGDDIVLPGPDWFKVIMFIAAAGYAFWYSIANREQKGK